MNFGVKVKVSYDKMILYKGLKSIEFVITKYGKDLFKRDVKMARNMM